MKLVRRLDKACMDADQVAFGIECPYCGECRREKIRVDHEDESARCLTCRTSYTLDCLEVAHEE